VHYIRPNPAGELRDPFDCDEQVVSPAAFFSSGSVGRCGASCLE